MFDVNLILETYGLIGIFIEITAIEIANSFFLRDAIAHPCPLVIKISKINLIVKKYCSKKSKITICQLPILKINC